MVGSSSARRFVLVMMTSVAAFHPAARAAVEIERRDAILKEIEVLYAPVARSQGLNLLIETKLESPTVVASAEHDGTTLRLTIHGGLLESRKLSEDGLRMALCHEMGHFFGGSPRRAPPPEWDGPIASDGLSLLSSEGQADYYASLVCFRNLVNGRPSSTPVTPRLARLCDASWGTGTASSMACRRAVAGGLNFLLLVKGFPISVETPDLSQTPTLVRDLYPSRQCRLDTMVQGAVCRASKPLALDAQDSNENGCSAGQPDAERPRCWYLQASPTADKH